jgi:hypothetical protein
MVENSYPADTVKKFLEPIVPMKLNTQVGTEGPKIAKEFDVRALPTLVMITPNGETLKRIEGGLETPDQFTGAWTVDLWNLYVGCQNATPQDKKGMAKNLFPLATWFPQSEHGKKALEIAKENEKDPDFKSTWDELAAQTERQNLWAKADAQMKLRRKKDEIVATLKTIVEKHPDSKEATDSKALLKKMGVKLEEPAK